MVLDTSSLIAIFFHEQEREAFLAKIDTASICYISAATLVEAASVILWKKKQLGVDQLDRFIEAFGIEVVAVDHDQATIAMDAYAKYGKGRNHPAHLNFGDCFSYALARHLNQPLLFKGDDFVHTDILIA